MNRSTGSLVATILLIATVPAVAQLLNVPTKGIPRTKDGKPNLSVPAPRKPDGKPDLSGLWQADPQNRKYIRNLAEDFKPGEFPMQPWAEALTRERQTDAGQSELPASHCLPLGIPLLDASGAAQGGYPLKIIQEPDLVVFFTKTPRNFARFSSMAGHCSKIPIPLGWAIRSAGGMVTH